MWILEKERMDSFYCPYAWFQWHFRYLLGRISVDDERQINRWKNLVTRFKGKLVNEIRFDDHSISLKISQILLHWGCELTESDLL